MSFFFFVCKANIKEDNRSDSVCVCVCVCVSVCVFSVCLSKLGTETTKQVISITFATTVSHFYMALTLKTFMWLEHIVFLLFAKQILRKITEPTVCVCIVRAYVRVCVCVMPSLNVIA